MSTFIYQDQTKLLPGSQKMVMAYSGSGGGTASPIPFAVADSGSEVYDFGNFHDLVTNTPRITLTATGLYRFGGNMRDTAAQSVTLNKNGVGWYHAHRGSTDGNRRAFVFSFPHAGVATDYFTLTSAGGSASQVPGQHFWAEKLDATLRYAFVATSGGQVMAAGDNLILFPTEVADTSSWHDTGSDTERLTNTIGAGRIMIVIQGNLGGTSGGAGNNRFFMRKAGATTEPGLGKASGLGGGGSGGANLNIVSAPMNSAINDYFDCIWNTDKSSSPVLNAYASIEEVPPEYDCCLAKRSSNQAVTAATPAIINWNEEVYDDTGAIHDIVTNSSRMYAPPNATFAMLLANIEDPSTNGKGRIRFLKNGAVANGLLDTTNRNSGAADNAHCNAAGGWVPCVGGTDYFETEYTANNNGNVGSNAYTWFAVLFRYD